MFPVIDLGFFLDPQYQKSSHVFLPQSVVFPDQPLLCVDVVEVEGHRLGGMGIAPS